MGAQAKVTLFGHAGIFLAFGSSYRSSRVRFRVAHVILSLKCLVFNGGNASDRGVSFATLVTHFKKFCVLTGRTNGGAVTFYEAVSPTERGVNIGHLKRRGARNDKQSQRAFVYFSAALYLKLGIHRELSRHGCPAARSGCPPARGNRRTSFHPSRDRRAAAAPHRTRPAKRRYSRVVYVPSEM